MNARVSTRLVQSRPRCFRISTPTSFTTPPAVLQCRCLRITPPRKANSKPTSTTNNHPSHPLPYRATILLAGAGLAALAFSLYPRQSYALDATSDQPILATELPSFRLDEIRKHDGESTNPWIIHGNKVYDITEWVPAHPGGDVILRAAGGPVDRYWDIFSMHKSQYVYEVLSHYLIGYVDEADLAPDGAKPLISDEIDDPFSDDPKRHVDLITRTDKPRNAETPRYALESSFLTPNDLFYVRNHMWVPVVDQPEKHTLTIELADGSTKSYTLADLKKRFKKHTVTSVLQCSGNRRSNMSEWARRKANGLPWDTGAISNAQWEGVLLADVLADAGYSSSDESVKHVHFSAMEAYAASIPIRKAMDPLGDVLLAWGMNGQPLPRDHGFPLRSIVPGNVAARSVKWLKQITLSDEESPSQWQRKDYKCFGPNETDVDWNTAPSIQEMPVQSAITSVKVGEIQNDVKSTEEQSGRPLTLTGYAYSGGGRAIVRVDVSLDGGHNWSQAYLLPDCSGPSSQCIGNGTWSWKRWRFQGVIPNNLLASGKEDQQQDGQGKICTTLVVKATDEAYNTQPESYASTWNVRGNLTSAWHRVRMCTDCAGQLKKA